MKRVILSLFTVVAASAALLAQTPEEVIARMEEETSRFDKEGFSMIMEIKMPIIGTVGTTVYNLGNKYKMVLNVKDKGAINWSDRITDWSYDESKNEVTISNSKQTEETQADSNKKMLDSVTDGYDIQLKKETDAAWFFRCTKSKTNTRKDDPKNMDLVVSKATHLPISLKSTLHGVTVTLRDFAIGVSENDVTFDPADFPGVKIIDNR